MRFQAIHGVDLLPVIRGTAVMHDLASWCVNLGRWGGVHIRLHAFFLLFAVCTFYLCVGRPHPGPAGGGSVAPAAESVDETARQLHPRAPDGVVEVPLTWICALALTILFFSVLLHELAHAYATVRVGGDIQQLVLGPLGGLTQGHVPHEPQRELIAALAGPMANLTVAFALVPVLLVVADARLPGLLNPLTPQAIVEGSLYQVAVKLTFWLNWSLALINLLPAYPFDGGRVLRAVLWPRVGYRTAVLAVARTAKVSAAGICVLAWLMHDAYDSALVPVWVPLLLIAIFLYFSGSQEALRLAREEQDDALFEYDFSQGYTSLQQQTGHQYHSEHVGLLEGWRERRRQVKQQERTEREAEEEARVDAILARLHETGIADLSAEDRALLERVSARYRQRQDR